jgi:hypothetical protein
MDRLTIQDKGMLNELIEGRVFANERRRINLPFGTKLLQVEKHGR